MLRKILVAAACVIFLTGCATTLPIPTRMDSPAPNALAIFKVSASGKFVSGLSYSQFGDEPLKLILKNSASGKEYQGELLLQNYVFFPNLPLGTYRLEKAQSQIVFQVLMVSNPVMVSFNGFSQTIDLTKEGVNYVASYGITTKQKDFGLDVVALDEKPKTDAETAQLKKFINQDNSSSGWHF